MRIIWTLLIIIGGIYVGVALLLFLFQSRLIHLPDIPSRELMVSPNHVGLDYESLAITTDDNVELHAWWVPALQPRGVLLFFHGNAGNISHRLDSLVIFHHLGLSTLIFDYRGYGRSEGSPSEGGIYRDAEAVLRYINAMREVPMDDLVFFGRSMGSAVAAWLAARYPPAALIVESAFTSVPDIAAELYPIFPARLLARIHYDTLGNIEKVRSPVLVIHSREDEIIPFHHGRRLFAAANEPKRFLEIRGDHNTGFLYSRDIYESGIASFLEAHLDKTPSGNSPQYLKR